MLLAWIGSGPGSQSCSYVFSMATPSAVRKLAGYYLPLLSRPTNDRGLAAALERVCYVCHICDCPEHATPHAILYIAASYRSPYSSFVPNGPKGPWTFNCVMRPLLRRYQ
jgi:hypothetical protein